MIFLKNKNKKIKIKKNTRLVDVINTLSDDVGKDIISAYVNNKIVDLNYNLTEDSVIKPIYLEDDESLNIIRHSCAHLLAHAIKLLYKDVNIAIGPVIKNGFYYDFSIKHILTINDFDIIEKKMSELVKEKIPIIKYVITKSVALDLFKNEKFKIEIINNLKPNTPIVYYKQKNFIDLCKGPHVINTKYLKNFKLIKLSGAYWKNNSNNEMLKRIYGTAWDNNKKLNDYIIYLNEIKKRDHKYLGPKLNLFHFQKDSPGVIFWNTKGWKIYIIIINYLRILLNKNNYQEVNTPSILNSNIFEKSGHMDKFSENIFKYYNNNNVSILKPMICPCHIQIFNKKIKSYKELPLRLFEFGLI